MAVSQHIKIARATIADNVEIIVEDEDEVHVTAGQPFSVGLSYRLYEKSADRDSWHFVIETRIDDDTPQSTDITVRDRPFIRDDQWSNVSTEHTLPAGTHNLQFRVRAVHEQGGWGDSGPATLIGDAEQTGTLRIVAR